MDDVKRISGLVDASGNPLQSKFVRINIPFTKDKIKAVIQGRYATFELPDVPELKPETLCDHVLNIVKEYVVAAGNHFGKKTARKKYAVVVNLIELN